MSASAHPSALVECVINVSEGRDEQWLGELAEATTGCVDLHLDADHHRSVFTLIGTQESIVDEVVSFGRSVIDHLDLTKHVGVHPRIGVLDVVPFVPLGDASLHDAAILRDQAALRLAEEFDLPCFLYGPLNQGDRSLPSIRKSAFAALLPDVGPKAPHPTAGACAVGARSPLVAWNIWLSGTSLAEAKEFAASIRSEHVRALGLRVGESVQVSCNLLAPTIVTPSDLVDRVQSMLRAPQQIERCELVGLVPIAVLDAIDPTRWASLDLREEKTIERAVQSLGLGQS